MTALERFTFPVTGAAVRTVELDGEPYFVAADVTAILGYTNGRAAVAQHVDEEDRNTVAIRDGMRGNPNATAVNESGLYALIFGSRLESAKVFKRWVTADVLPTLRRTGSYSVAVPQSLPEALRAYADEVESHQHTKAALNEATPKADAWDVLAAAKGDYSVREAAHILNRDPAIDTGQNRLFRKLRELKLLDARGIPYARHSRHVVLRARTWRTPDGVEQTDDQVRITADGLKYLRRCLGASPELPGLEHALATTSTEGQ
ncbi:BRO family protein [Glycomyces sp. NPDC046736]|uniref:phage antirepressor n=1 Tax=Glycomyces sp. NPDC046736 TaxID=3155615 RepID=UPI0033D832E2